MGWQITEIELQQKWNGFGLLSFKKWYIMMRKEVFERKFIHHWKHGEDEWYKTLLRDKDLFVYLLNFSSAFLFVIKNKSIYVK